MNNIIKPFYIYTDKNTLYIKNINEQTEKLANNIYTYSANIDDDNNIHICALDTKGKLIHFFNSNGSWKKKSIHQIFNNIKQIKEIKLYIINNIFNLFTVEKNSTFENIYKISHFNFTNKDYKIYKYTINNAYKENEQFYKLNIDELSNIVFNYKTSIPTTRTINNNTILFNIYSRKWINSDLVKIQDNDVSNIKSNITEDIFEYCYSINYKI